MMKAHIRSKDSPAPESVDTMQTIPFDEEEVTSQHPYQPHKTPPKYINAEHGKNMSLSYPFSHFYCPVLGLH